MNGSEQRPWGSPPKVVAFIVARLASSRLPRKHLRTIGNRLLIDWVLLAARRARCLDAIVLTTLDNEENRPLLDWAHTQEVEVFAYKGAEEDVVGRLCAAAEHSSAEIAVLLSADCPLISGSCIDALVKNLIDHPEGDFAIPLDDNSARPSALMGVQVARASAWRRIDALSTDPEHRAHQFPLLYRDPRFQGLKTPLPDWAYGAPCRLTIDTFADLTMVNRLHRALTEHEQPFTLRHGLQMLRQQPQLNALNRHVHQRPLHHQDRRMLFIIDGAGPYGWGHVQRSIALARCFIERHGWSVGFVADHPQVVAALQEQGLVTWWGAWGRRARKRPESTTVPSLGSAALKQHTARYGATILDVSDQRPLHRAWFPPVWVLMDRNHATTDHRGLVIRCGPYRRKGFCGQGSPPFFSLVPNVEAPHSQGKKNQSVLVYLHRPKQRQQVCAKLKILGYTPVVPESFCHFKGQLQQAEILIGGFGVTFYEALSMQTFPVCLPHSPAHQQDAMDFYAWYELPDCTLSSFDRLGHTLKVAQARRQHPLPKVVDQTPQLAEHIGRWLEQP